MSKIKKLLISFSVIVTMAIAFVVASVGLNAKDVKTNSRNVDIGKTFKDMFAVTDYKFTTNEVKFGQSKGNTIKYEYKPDVNTKESSSVAFEYVFNNPMSKTMAISLENINTSGVTVSFAYSDNRLTNIENTSAPFETQTISQNKTKYIYVVVTANGEVPTTFQQELTWYQGVAKTMTYVNPNTYEEQYQTIVGGQGVELPSAPEFDGYVFMGWETESGESVSSPYFSQGETLVAKLASPNLPSDWIAWDEASSSYHVIEPRGYANVWNEVSESYEIEVGNTGKFSTLPKHLIIPATYDDGVHGTANVTALPQAVEFYAHTNSTGFVSPFYIHEAYTGKGWPCETIFIPSTITSIPNYAFSSVHEFSDVDDDYNLKKIIIPDSLVSIGNNAFGEYSIGGINREIVISKTGSNWNNLTTIGNEAFYYCDIYVELDFSQSQLTSIGNNAFYNCTELLGIKLPNTLKTIGSNAFYYCISLTDIVIPSTVTSIGSGAFQHCYKLKEVYNLSSISITKGGTTNGYAGYYAGIIHDSLADTSYIQEINGVKYYVDGTSFTALGRINYLVTDIVLDSRTKEIITYGFTNYLNQDLDYRTGNNITSVDLSNCNNLTTIGNCAFDSCGMLTSITIPSSVTSIGTSAFTDCYALAEVRNLSSINITTGSTSNGFVGYYAKTIIKDTTTSTYIQSINNVRYYVNGSTFMALVPTSTEVTSLKFNTQITSISDKFFANCNALSSIDFSNCNKLTEVDAYYYKNVDTVTNVNFSNCTGLTNYNSILTFMLGDNLETLNASGCTGLTSFNGPGGSCKNLNLSGCTGITWININGKIQTIGGEYKSGSYVVNVDLSNCTSLTSLDADTCIDLETINLDGCTSLESHVVIEDCNRLKMLDFSKTGITSFYACEFTNLPSLHTVKLPANLGSGGAVINDGIFTACRNLVQIYNPSSVSLTMGSSGNGGIAYNAKIIHTSLSATSKIQTNGNMVYYVNGSDYIALNPTSRMLTSVTLNSNTTEIQSYAFASDEYQYGNENGWNNEGYPYLTTVNLRNCTKLKVIGSYAFKGCSMTGCYNALTTVDLSNCTSLETIGTGAFYNCSNLTSITIPASVKAIGTYAFENSGLTSATFKQTAGWYRVVSRSGTASSITVTSTANAASYLRSSYTSYFWYNTNAGGSKSEYQ